MLEMFEWKLFQALQGRHANLLESIYSRYFLINGKMFLSGPH